MIEIRTTLLDETLLLDLLNTTPVVDGMMRDELVGCAAGRRWLAAHGRPASDEELRAVVDVRTVLQEVIRGSAPPASLARFVERVAFRASFTEEGLSWALDLPEGRSTAAQVVLVWNALRIAGPGRLRSCANPECRLFLIDRSKPNRARWCSMAVCGNRMKARRHYQRTHSRSEGSG